jgi:hypothetical protein
MSEINLLFIGLIDLLIILSILYGSCIFGKTIIRSEVFHGIPVGLPIILTIISGLTAILYVNINTIFIIPLLFIFAYFFKTKFYNVNLKEFTYLLIFFLPYFILLYYLKSSSLFLNDIGIISSSTFDDYSYTSQINLLGKYKKETWFLELERESFSMDSIYKPYHYFEFYLSLLFKFFSRQNNYCTYHLSTLPILQTFALGIATLAVRKYSKWTDIQVLLVCFSFFLCLRYTILDEIIFQKLPVSFIHIFKHFVFQKVFLNQAGIHFLSSYFGFKISISLIFIGYLIIYPDINSKNKFFILSIFPFISTTYIPFVIIFCLINLIFNYKDINFFLPIFSISLFFIFYTIYGSHESQGIHGDKIDIFESFYNSNIKNFMSIFNRINESIIIILEFIYLPILILNIILFFSLGGIRKYKLPLMLISAFPFFIYEKGIGLYLYYTLFFISSIIIYRPYFGIIIRSKNRELILSLIVLFISFNLFSFIWDISQIFNLIFYATFPVLILIIVSKQSITKIYLFYLTVTLFSAFSVFNLTYDSRRSHHPVIQDKNVNLKIKSWLSKIRSHKAVHFNLFTNPPFLTSSIVGNEFLNYSDSLVNAYVSLDKLTKNDSSIIKKFSIFGYYERLPFVEYYRTTQLVKPKLDLRKIQIAFIKKNDIQLVFKADVFPNSEFEFIRRSAIDSIRIENKQYSCFLIDPNHLN